MSTRERVRVTRTAPLALSVVTVTTRERERDRHRLFDRELNENKSVDRLADPRGISGHVCKQPRRILSLLLREMRKRERGGIPRSFIHFAKQRPPLSRSGFPIEEKHLETISRESIGLQRNSRGYAEGWIGRMDCKWWEYEETLLQIYGWTGSRGERSRASVELDGGSSFDGNRFGINRD